MASYTPFELVEDISRGDVDFDTDSFKMMLVDNTYTPSQAHSKRSDYTADEVSGTGYTAGGATTTVTVSRSNGVASMTFSNVTWTGAGPGWTARRAVIYKDRGGAASADEVVAVIDFGGDQVTNGTDFVVQLSSALTITTPTGT